MCIGFNYLIKEKEENNFAVYGHTKIFSHSVFSPSPSLVFALDSFHGHILNVSFFTSLDFQALCCPCMSMPIFSSSSFPRGWRSVITGEGSRGPISMQLRPLGSISSFCLISGSRGRLHWRSFNSLHIRLSNVSFLLCDPVGPYALGLVMKFRSCPIFLKLFWYPVRNLCSVLYVFPSFVSYAIF